MDFQDLLIGAGFNWVLSTIKNTKSRAKFRAVILKVFKAIWAAFSSDDEFQAVVNEDA